MDFDFREDQPIFLQLAKSLEMAVISGELLPGQKLPSVRELAAESRTNPNTVQKALKLLEERSLICTRRTSGKFVSEDECLLKQLRHEKAVQIVQECLSDLQALGLDYTQAVSLFQNLEEERI